MNQPSRPVVVSIPTLSPQGAERTRQLVRSLRAGTRAPDVIFIVDNGGHFGEQEGTVVFRPPSNIGVAPAWNAATRGYPDHIVVLANDDVLVAPDSLDLIVREVERAGDNVGLVLTHGHPFTFFSPTRAGLRRVGDFDEGFFPAYYEDTDYLRRVRMAGMEAPQVVTKTAHPDESRTTKDLGHRKAVRWDENEARYKGKWGGPKGRETFASPWNIKLDCVIPSLRPSMIPRLLRSFARQTMRPDNVFIVTNADLRGIETWGMPVCRVGFRSSEYVVGDGDVSLRRNLGTWAARSPFVVYSDDDQVWPQDAIESFAKLFAKGERFVVGHHRFLAVGSRLDTVEILTAAADEGRSREQGVNRLHGWQSCYGGCLGAQVSLIKQIGGWDLSRERGEDQHIAMRIGGGPQARFTIHEPPFAWHGPGRARYEPDPHANSCRSTGQQHEWEPQGIVQRCKRCPKVSQPKPGLQIGQRFDPDKVEVTLEWL